MRKRRLRKIWRIFIDIVCLFIIGFLIGKLLMILVSNSGREPAITESAFVVEDDYIPYTDPDNYVEPFNELSADWDTEIYNEGYRYYKIPEIYKVTGGCFPEVVQVYLWSLCQERDLDYYIVVALIERESSYRWDAYRAGDNSVGYMQIIEKYHKERIAEECADISSPYGNIRVGVSFLSELYERYGNWDKALMCYNMGETGAKRFWAKGQYSTDYSTGIINRAQEIKHLL